MAFRDYSNNDRFDRDRRGFRPDPRSFDDRSDWNGADDRAQAKYRNANWLEEPLDRGRYNENDRGEYYRPPFGTVRPWRDEDDPYIRDQRMLRERGEMQYGRDYGYAGSNYYGQHRRHYDPRDRHWGSENLDAQQNFERDRPNFRGGGWDQGEPMRSRHMNGSREERYAFERDRGYPDEHHYRAGRDQARYNADPDSWSSMEHDWNGPHYYGGGRNRTGDYGSYEEPYDWRDNFGKDRVYSRSGRGTTTGWAGGDRSLGSSDLGSS